MLDIEDFKKSIGNKSRLLGIDPGKKRIGLAISDEDKLVSTPLKTILKKKNFDFIDYFTFNNFFYIKGGIFFTLFFTIYFLCGKLRTIFSF